MEGTLNSNITVGSVKRYAGATGHDLHHDVPLTNLTIDYEPQGLIAPLIYPIVPVEKESNTFFTWPKAESLRLHDAYRARGREANEIHMDVSSDGYQIKNYALAINLPLEDIDNADAPLQIRASAARRALGGLNLAWEDRLAVTLTTTTNMASSTALVNNWDDTTDGAPVDDLYTGINAIRGTTGLTPNVGLFSFHAWQRFSKHPDVIEFIRGRGDNRGGGAVTEAQVAQVFGLSRVLVGKGLKNTAVEGRVGAYTDIWSTACVLLYVAPQPGLMEPSHGYTFRWSPAGFPGGMSVERMTIPIKHVERVEVHQFQDEKVTGADLGYLIVGT